MTSNLYPSPSTAPLLLKELGHDDDTSFWIHFDPSLAGIGDTLYIRIAMSDPTCSSTSGLAPTVFLKAGSGDENLVPFSPGRVTIYDKQEPVDPFTDTVGDAQMFDVDEFDNVFQIEVVNLAKVPASWEIKFQNNHDAERYFTWVVADNDAESRQPWLDISSTTPLSTTNSTSTRVLDFDDTTGKPLLTGQQTDAILQIFNRGTGPLCIEDAPGDIGDTNFEIISIPSIDPNSCDDTYYTSSIPPSSCGDMRIRFNAPASPGESTATYTIGSTDLNANTDPDNFHNKQVELRATCGKLELMMLLDTSGSMAWTPTGSSPPSNSEESRWGRLESAAEGSLNLLLDYSNGFGRFGVSMFPDSKTPSAERISAADFFPPNDITSTNIEDAINSLIGHNCKGKTPMGEGIAHVVGTDGFGHFEEFEESLDYNQRVMVLMSDGAHNVGPPPSDFYRREEGDTDDCSEIEGTLPEDEGRRSFLDKGIRVITVAYGDEPGLDVVHETLVTLACKSDGDNVIANVSDDPNGIDPIAKAMWDTIIEVLNLQVFSDPTGLLTAAVSEVRSPIQITPYDSKVTFLVDWDTFDENRVNVQLLTPTCDLITPETAQNEPDITYHSHPRGKLFTIGQEYLRNTSNPKNPRYGTWKLIISGNGLESGESEPFQYGVMMESRLKLKLSLNKMVYYAGDPIELTATVTLDGKPLGGAAVLLHLTAPGQSAVNWLAKTKVTDVEYAKSAALLKDADITPLGIKSHAIRLKGSAFNNFKNSSTISMTDEHNQGFYKATVSNTSVTGIYKLYVKVTGQTKDGELYHREIQRQVRVGARPDPDYTWIDTVYTRVVEDERIFYRVDIKVWPRDRFGNMILVDPEFNPAVLLTAKGGEPTGPMVGNLDGSYSRTFRSAIDAKMTFNLKVKGESVIESQRILSVALLHYADQILAFEPGLTGKDQSDQHYNPEDALGDVTIKQEDQFVNLGISGSLALGLKNQAIFAGSGEDVVVFVKPDDDLHPYQVEVLPLYSKEQWIELGTSPGVTSAFSLRTAGLKSVKAIRINDRSSRFSSSRSKSGIGPGVSILGVGFGKVGPISGKAEGCLALPITIARRLLGSNK